LIPQLDFAGPLGDTAALAACLTAAGLSPEAARSKAQRFAQAAAAVPSLDDQGRPVRPRAFFVPGRIEVLGKHTDYAGGASILAAAERGFCLVAAPRSDRLVSVLDVRCGQQAEFPLDADLVPTVGLWANYPMTVARRVARNFPGACRGAAIALASDLPPAAGMSSSSAMMVGTFLALAAVNNLFDRPDFRGDVRNLVDLAGYLATIENGQTFGTLAGDRGVGTFGGSEDHTAILNCRAGQLSQYAYCPVRLVGTVPMPPGTTFAIGSCGVVAEKTGAAMAKYNRASGLAAQVADLWRRATGRDDPHLAAALASSPDAAGRLADAVRSAGLDRERTDALLARLRHFVGENQEILPAAVERFARSDVAALGPLVDRSQKLSEDFLGNQIPQTIRLAALARSCGAAAASAFGAGFGGSVWALVPTSEADRFLGAWSAAYAGEFPQNAAAASFFLSGAGPGAFRVC
jgi:galactokinase